MPMIFPAEQDQQKNSKWIKNIYWTASNILLLAVFSINVIHKNMFYKFLLFSGLRCVIVK